MLTTTSDVGNATQDRGGGGGFGITKRYPSVVRSILRHFAGCFGGFLGGGGRRGGRGRAGSPPPFRVLRPCLTSTRNAVPKLCGKAEWAAGGQQAAPTRASGSGPSTRMLKGDVLLGVLHATAAGNCCRWAHTGRRVGHLQLTPPPLPPTQEVAANPFGRGSLLLLARMPGSAASPDLPESKSPKVLQENLLQHGTYRWMRSTEECGGGGLRPPQAQSRPAKKNFLGPSGMNLGCTAALWPLEQTRAIAHVWGFATKLGQR